MPQHSHQKTTPTKDHLLMKALFSVQQALRLTQADIKNTFYLKHYRNVKVMVWEIPHHNPQHIGVRTTHMPLSQLTK